MSENESIVDGLTIDRLMEFLATSLDRSYLAEVNSNPGYRQLQAPVLIQRFLDVLVRNTLPNRSFPPLIDYLAQSMSVALRGTNGVTH